MPEPPIRLLEGIRVVDAAGEPAALAGRVLADLGATVVKVGPLPGDAFAARAWELGCERAEAAPRAFKGADIVIETPGWPGCPVLDPAWAPGATWVTVTPFGLTGPRSGWRASDLGVMAASGNMHATGDPDRAPLRPSQPAAYSHTGPEVALAALTGLASGRPQRIDVSMQEVVGTANMCGPARAVRGGEPIQRRGANIGRSREIWPCADGWVSFGLRSGKARVPSLETITRLCVDAGVATPALAERDWTTWSHTEASDEELRSIEEPIAEFFARRTMTELYEIACETNVMLAPINSPREIYASAQLAARDFFDPVSALPRSFLRIGVAPAGTTPGGATPTPRAAGGGRAWEGTKILEFGSGAAGPISTRYFVEHGATVLRVESKSRPDFLRVYALGPDNPHGLEGSVMFDGMNVGKLSVALNLKHPQGVAVAGRLVRWADAVVENFAPRAMKGFGLDYETLAQGKPDLLMVSSCLNGQTGPHKDYPGFGGQGAALSGWNFVTGWPDREPVGPFGTITDSLAPRFVAAAIAAGLLYRQRTGGGAHLDVSQVECGTYALSPWLLRFRETGEISPRMGNGHPSAPLHGAFPCRGDDQWVAIACWNTGELDRLEELVGGRSPEAVGGWTSEHEAPQVAEMLQGLGIEAVPVQPIAELLDDPQLARRRHFVTRTHPAMGEGPYERNGFRLSDGDGGYDAPGPTLGQHNRHVLADLLGLSDAEIGELVESGAVE